MLNNKRGFTIIEMLAAIFFLSVGITAILVAVQQTSAYMNDSFSRLTAAYLAQEGIEIVRNIRDGNWLKGSPSVWDTGLDLGDWEADYNSSQGLTVCSAPCDSNLRFLKINSNGFYNYNLGNDTIFKRKITISKNTADQMKVRVKVSWEQKGPHDVSAEGYLYNWRE